MATTSSHGALSSSLEDYLETILRITLEQKVARAKDISKRMGVNNSSVTGALRTLAERGLVNYAPYDLITLTPEGEEAASDVYRRHLALRNFFIKVLHIDPQTADEGACKVEHGIPPLIVDRLIQFADYIDRCPSSGAEWIQGFGYACQGSAPVAGARQTCPRCASSCIATTQDQPLGLPSGAVQDGLGGKHS